MLLEKNEKLRYTLGVVYAPDEEDAQGDFSDSEEIRKASWKFLQRLQGHQLTKHFLEEVVKVLKSDEIGIVDVSSLVEEYEIEKRIGIMHKEFDPGIGEVVESFLAPVDMQIAEEMVKKGSWLLGVVWNEEAFAKVLKGELNGYSMGGVGVRIPEGEVS